MKYMWKVTETEQNMKLTTLAPGGSQLNAKIRAIHSSDTKN